MSLWTTMVNISPAGKIAVSLIAKDAVGCYLYTTQARSNKKMSVKQRSDVANYDFFNGIINISLQLLAIKPIEYGLNKVSKSKLMKHFFKDYDKRLTDPATYSKNSVKDASGAIKHDYKNLDKLLKEKGTYVKGSVALVSAILCQYFIKRCISPFFSVPAGEWGKKVGIIKPKLYPGETMPDLDAEHEQKKPKVIHMQPETMSDSKVVQDDKKELARA